MCIRDRKYRQKGWNATLTLYKLIDFDVRSKQRKGIHENEIKEVLMRSQRKMILFMNEPINKSNNITARSAMPTKSLFYFGMNMTTLSVLLLIKPKLDSFRVLIIYIYVHKRTTCVVSTIYIGSGPIQSDRTHLPFFKTERCLHHLYTSWNFSYALRSAATKTIYSPRAEGTDVRWPLSQGFYLTHHQKSTIIQAGCEEAATEFHTLWGEIWW